jgi:predicted nucleic acid-binding protein
MRRFLLDTNICLAFVRGHESYKSIEQELQLDSEDCVNMISVVTKAELLSLGKRLGWGGTKLDKLNSVCP